MLARSVVSNFQSCAQHNVGSTLQGVLLLVAHLAWQCPSGLWSIFLTYMYNVTHPPPLNTMVLQHKIQSHKQTRKWRNIFYCSHCRDSKIANTLRVIMTFHCGIAIRDWTIQSTVTSSVVLNEELGLLIQIR